jgi:RNA polymerase sigma-70 factor (sigma-E family)
VQVDDWLESGLPGLVRFARVLTGDRGLAEDIVQDVLTRLVAEPERFGRVADLDAYLRRMVANSYVSWGRKWFRIRPTEVLPEPRSAASEPHNEVLDRDELRSALAKLPRRQRAVIVLRFYEDMSDIEIAALLGCSQGTVRSHASRALSALRLDIGDMQGERLP